MLQPTTCLMLCISVVLSADITWLAVTAHSRNHSGTELAASGPNPEQSSGWQPEWTNSAQSAVIESDPFSPFEDSQPSEAEADIRYFPEALVADERPAEGQTAAPQEMSDEEARIWKEQLSDLPAGHADQIMELRSQLGSVIDGTHSESTGPGPRPLSEAVVSDAQPIPTFASSADTVLLASGSNVSPAMQRLQDEANDVYRENLANCLTPGFKRREILMISTAGEADSTKADEDSTGPTWITRLDLTPGRIRETGNPLDVAIRGRGWLKVSNGATQGFTRCGILGVDDTGLLGVWTGAGLLPLSPAINVGSNREFVIHADGLVQRDDAEAVSTAESEPLRLTLHTFQNPSALDRTAAGLYVATSASGNATPRPRESAPGTFVGQALEQSNAETEREQSELRQILTLPEPARLSLLD